MPSDFVELPGSHHAAPAAMRRLGRVPEDQPITVSLYLKPREPQQPAGDARPSRDDLRKRREESHADDLARIAAFARDEGLTVVAQDAARRLVRLSGPARTLERAFGTEISHYEAPGGAVYRGREGALHLPATLGDRVVAVLGLDTTPIATPKLVPHRGTAKPRGHLPTEVAALYGFEGARAAGQCVGIIELGGGYTAADNAAAFGAMGLDVPEVIAVSVDGTENNPDDGSGANGEVALDIQVAGGVAPGARLAVYFAPNTSQGFADAITQAVHDQDNRPSALSISWGSAEDGWSGQAIAAMHQAFEDAATLGVSVFAASGDALATDGERDGAAHVDYPASDPLVVGCGGTHITVAHGAISHETAWKSNGGGTGGGVSALFAKPAYQDGIDVPPAPAKAGGRGVPDVAGSADPDSGYRIVTGGQTGLVGGTSAVAPLWAGIAAVLNAARTAPLGDPHRAFYQASAGFRDVTSGNNRSGRIGFDAAPGWDPCTGLGSPVGAALRRAFGKAGNGGDTADGGSADDR